MSHARAALLPALAALLVLSMGAGLWLPPSDRGWDFVTLAGVQAVIYGGVAVIVLRRDVGRRALVACLIGAALMRAIPLAAPPFLSDDVYRYVWDGRVQGAGINPYRYVPADPMLAPLRDDAVYPHINRKDYAPTIYPPGAQMLFFLVTRIAASVSAMKLAMVGFEALTVALIWAMLRRAGLPVARVLLYALHPLPAWEFAGSGHVDAAMIALTTAALFLHQRGGTGSTGVALAAAALIKPFPLAILPALYRRWDWRLPVAVVVTVAVAYGPYLGVGRKVLGFLPSYVAEEGLASGIAFYPLWLVQALLPVVIPTLVYVAVAAALLLALALAVVLRGGATPAEPTTWRAALWLAAAVMVLGSPHFPWYLAWLLPLACLAPWLPALYLVSASVLLYLPVEFALVGSIAYGGALLLALITGVGSSILPLREKSDVIAAR